MIHYLIKQEYLLRFASVYITIANSIVVLKLGWNQVKETVLVIRIPHSGRKPKNQSKSSEHYSNNTPKHDTRLL